MFDTTTPTLPHAAPTAPPDRIAGVVAVYRRSARRYRITNGLFQGLNFAVGALAGLWVHWYTQGHHAALLPYVAGTGVLAAYGAYVLGMNERVPPALAIKLWMEQYPEWSPADVRRLLAAIPDATVAAQVQQWIDADHAAGALIR